LKAIQTLAWKAVFQLPDSGLALAGKQLELAERAGIDVSMYDAHTTMAVAHAMTGSYDQAIEHLEECLTIARRIGERYREANTFNNMSNVYRNVGDLPMALRLLHQSLVIDEELGNQAGLAGTYNNIGNIQKEQGEEEEALASYQRSAALYGTINDDRGKAQTLMNMGAIHLNMGQLDLAVRELSESLELLRRMGRKLDMGITHNTLGRAYSIQGKGDMAHRHLDSARTIFHDLGARRQMARMHYYTGEQYLAEKRYNAAAAACAEGLEVARATGLLLQEKECLDCLVKAHSERGDHRSAFLALQEHAQVNDSLARLNNSKELTRLEVTRQFQERLFADSLRTVKERFDREQEYQARLSHERDRRNLFIYSSVGILLLAGGLWGRLRQMRRSRAAIRHERDRSELLLLNILPAAVAEELKDHGQAEARLIDQVTVLFTDFKGFTQLTETLTPKELVRDIHECFSGFDRICEKYGVEKIKTIGDAYMAAGGLPTPNSTHAMDVVLAALEMRDLIEEGKARRIAEGRPYFEVRIGMHTGPVVAGIVGLKKFQYDIWGDTVNTAARMESSGEVGKVNVSESTYQLVSTQLAVRSSQLPGSRTTDNGQLTTASFTFTPRGKVLAKGKGELEMFFVRRSSEGA
jgi:class 3 adenylate cyclase/Tfp pilus assembly protein PilF